MSENHVKSLRGENRTFAECLTTVSQVKKNGFYAGHNYAVINLLIASVLPWIYNIVTSLTVLLGLLLPKNCILSLRHTQETSLYVVTQQVVYLLKVKHEDSARPIPAFLVIILYLVRVRNKNLVVTG